MHFFKVLGTKSALFILKGLNLELLINNDQIKPSRIIGGSN